jgi:hypothetical protein
MATGHRTFSCRRRNGYDEVAGDATQTILSCRSRRPLWGVIAGTADFGPEAFGRRRPISVAGKPSDPASTSLIDAP